jgi:hypothetical protein
VVEIGVGRREVGEVREVVSSFTLRSVMVFRLWFVVVKCTSTRYHKGKTGIIDTSN